MTRHKREYIDRLFHWNAHADDYEGEWARFLLK